MINHHPATDTKTRAPQADSDYDEDTIASVGWARGKTALLSTRSVAIVGARAATGYGENVTMTLTQGLVDDGWTIVSGAAYGIDGMAHRATLASRGNTVAVLDGEWTGTTRPATTAC